MKANLTQEQKENNAGLDSIAAVRSSHSLQKKRTPVFHHKKLLEAVLHSEERERKRIADFLNEDLGSFLSSVKLKFSLLDNEISTLSDTAKTEFETALKMLDDAIEQLRNVAHEATPISLEFGLLKAIQSLADRVNDSGLLKVNLHYLSDNFTLKNKSLETTVYRIIQELLNNAIYHSKAKEADIYFTMHDDSLQIKVSDDGIGFNYEKEKINSKGLGLQKINQRVQVFGGIIEVKSSSESGTYFNIELPLG